VPVLPRELRGVVVDGLPARRAAASIEAGTTARTQATLAHGRSVDGRRATGWPTTRVASAGPRLIDPHRPTTTPVSSRYGNGTSSRHSPARSGPTRAA